MLPKVCLRMTLLEDLVLHSNQNPKAVIFNEYYADTSHMFVIHFVLYIEKISVLKCQTLLMFHCRIRNYHNVLHYIAKPQPEV